MRARVAREDRAVTTPTECGRNQQGHLQCHPQRRCGDCPLNTPVSDQEREIAAQRDGGK